MGLLSGLGSGGGLGSALAKWARDDAKEAQRRREQAAEAKGWATVTGTTVINNPTTSWPTALPNTGIGLGVPGGVISRPAPSQWELDEARYRGEMMAMAEMVVEEETQKELSRRFLEGDPSVFFDSATDKYIQIHSLPTAPPKPENAIKATVHKAGHFPTNWMIEAYERGQKSDVLITIQVEKDGVVVIGEEGDAYETITLSWVMMEKAQTNPVIIGIETVEKHLATLANLKQRVRAGKK